MFYKGVLQSYDQAFEAGKILLTDSNEVIDFSLHDLPNSALEPRIGERIKCVVDKSKDFACAKLIVRLDKKNAQQDIHPTPEKSHNDQEEMLQKQKDIQYQKQINNDVAVVLPEYVESLEKQIRELQNQLAEHRFNHQTVDYFETVLKAPIQPNRITTDFIDLGYDFVQPQVNHLHFNDPAESWFKKIKVLLNYKIYKPSKQFNTKLESENVIQAKKVKRPNQISYIVPLSLITVIMTGLMVHFGSIAYTQYQMHNLNQELKVQEYLKEQKLIIEEQKRIVEGKK
ncbi:hypothetical protein [Acinetobacter shaoyimingii]|uniref:Uncharacterized protein n=1 Tax=Acinetobacter shaoyimingii TaxID=2715164 RepID=A0A6G8RXN9_9GAMM|nr:hypothetical protein [Acinetobacter shaoyimingii]QIO06712.1 hypothetical protein G8E00_12550 [Acinetobacter shaoyimingii]